MFFLKREKGDFEENKLSKGTRSSPDNKEYRNHVFSDVTATKGTNKYKPVITKNAFQLNVYFKKLLLIYFLLNIFM